MSEKAPGNTPPANHGMQSLLFFMNTAALVLVAADLFTFLSLLQGGGLDRVLSGNAARDPALLEDTLFFFSVLMALCFAACGGYMACVRYMLRGAFGVAARLNCLLAAIMALFVAYSDVVGLAFQAQYTALALLWALNLLSLRHGFALEADRSLAGLFHSAVEYVRGLCGLSR